VAKKTVLLIDDEPSFLEALADALEYEGVHVLKAKTAAAGIKLLNNNRIDLVTIDIMIDPGDGLRGKIDSHNAGLYVCEYVSKHYKILMLSQSVLLAILKLSTRYSLLVSSFCARAKHLCEQFLTCSVPD